MCASQYKLRLSQNTKAVVSVAGEYISLLDTHQSFQEKSPDGDTNHPRWTQPYCKGRHGREEGEVPASRVMKAFE